MQAAIEAIRYGGATNIITVPGINYTGAWTYVCLLLSFNICTYLSSVFINVFINL